MQVVLALVAQKTAMLGKKIWKFAAVYQTRQADT